MSRFICRAKDKDGEWVKGAYFKFLPFTPAPLNNNIPETAYKHIILHEGFSDWNMPRDLKVREINPETLGQCTGMLDKYGIPMFEGDIIKGNWHYYLIEWGGRSFSVKDIKTKSSYKIDVISPEHSEIIGNKYDNPKILDGEIPKQWQKTFEDEYKDEPLF